MKWIWFRFVIDDRFNTLTQQDPLTSLAKNSQGVVKFEEMRFVRV